MKKPTLKVGQAVKVTWIDSTTFRGWHRLPLKSEDVRPEPIYSIGYVMHADKEASALTISTSKTDSVGPHGAMIDPFSIPWGCILEIKTTKKKA